MATVRDLSAGEVIPQIGFAPSQNQNGGWKASRKYTMLKETWESDAIRLRFAKGTGITTADPSIDSIYNFLSVESKNAFYEDSGTVTLTVNYTGAAAAQFGGESGADLDLTAQPTYRLEGRLRELSITEHPRFKELSKAEQVSIIGLMEGGYRYLEEAAGEYTAGLYYDNGSDGLSRLPEDFQITSDDGQVFIALANSHLVTYQAPTYTWTETTQGNSKMTSAQLNALGKITTPRGSPPKAGGSRNWLFTSASQQQIGDLYSTTLEWTLSEVEGWEEVLYTEAPQS